MLTKRCFKCLVEKPLEQFYKHFQMADGYRNKCKDCARAEALLYRRQYYVDNIDKVRANAREYQKQPHVMKAHEDAFKIYNAKHPERKRAQNTVNNAIQSGKLVPQPCWVCGKKAGAHHPDYDRPLDVVWLCQEHHMQAHALVK
jgi:hypothetical protein